MSAAKAHTLSHMNINVNSDEEEDNDSFPDNSQDNDMAEILNLQRQMMMLKKQKENKKRQKLELVVGSTLKQVSEKIVSVAISGIRKEVAVAGQQAGETTQVLVRSVAQLFIISSSLLIPNT